MSERPQMPERLRPYVGVIYLFAAVLMVLPLLNLAANLGELSPSIVRWRFGALGLLTGALLVPVMGLIVWGITAALMEHRWPMRITTVLAGIATLGLIALPVLFALDALQVRGDVNEALKGRFDVTIVQTMTAQLVLLLVMIFVLRASIKSLRSAKRAAEVRAPAQPDSMLVRAR